MQAFEIMKTHVVKTTPQATIKSAIDLMDLYRVQVLPVIDIQDRLCGLLTEDMITGVLLPKWGEKQDIETVNIDTDYMFSKSSAVDAFRKIGDSHVEDVMKVNPSPITENMDVCELMPVLFDGDIRHLPVVDDSGRVIGMIDRIDVMQAIFEGSLSQCP